MWRQSRRRPFCSCTSGHTRCRALAECATAEHVQYARWPPRSRRANCMSFTKIVWRLACIAHRLASWNSPTRWASHAVCSASTALDWKRYFAPQVSNATSFARRWNGSLRIRHSVDFWYLRISRRATVPARTRRRWRPRPSAARRRDCYSTFRLCHGWIYRCMRSGTPPTRVRMRAGVALYSTVNAATLWPCLGDSGVDASRRPWVSVASPLWPAACGALCRSQCSYAALFAWCAP